VAIYYYLLKLSVDEGMVEIMFPYIKRNRVSIETVLVSLARAMQRTESKPFPMVLQIYARANGRSCDNAEGVTTFTPEVMVCETQRLLYQSAAEVWGETMANQESRH